jgi:hypothetical protein
MVITVSGTEALVAHCGVVDAKPASRPRWAWLCVLLGVCLLLTGLGTAALLMRGLAERHAYVRASACGADPTGDCWVEVSAVVVGKHVVTQLFAADEQVIQINDLDGPEVALTGGADLWSGLRPGDRLTLRLWRGDFVHASLAGRAAETTASPLVGTSKWYSETAGACGLGGLLLIAGLGWSSRHRGAVLLRRRVFAVAARPALVAACVGVVGMVATLFTRTASLLTVTLGGVAVWVLAELATHAARLRRAGGGLSGTASAAAPAVTTPE